MIKRSAGTFSSLYPIATLLLGLAWILTGCSAYQSIVSPEIAQVAQGYSAQLLAVDGSVGQTFVSRFDGLQAIDVHIPTGDGLDGPLNFVLRAGPGHTADLAIAEMDPRQQPNHFRRFVFDPVKDSQGKRYYFSVEAANQAPLDVGANQPSAYWDGSAYLNHASQASTLTFRLYYDRNIAVRGMLQYLPSFFILMLVAFLLYVTPGLGLLALLLPEFRLHSWPTRLTLALGISLSIYPLILAWLQPLGLQLGGGNVALGLLVGIGGLVWRYARDRSRPPVTPSPQHSKSAPDSSILSGITLIIATILIVGIRLWVVRFLDVPMWGDSVQHAAITQLLLDNGGLFHSWEPYAAFDSLTVHFGFHANMAALAWITGMDGVRATVIGGQLLNAIAVLALYPLAEIIAAKTWKSFDSRWGGVVAVVVAGLLMTMPAFYVNWGRYSQLAGQAVLPAAIWLLWRATDSDDDQLGGKRFEWQTVLLAGLVLAGVTLNYYRMPIYYVAFGVAWLFLHIIPAWRLDGWRWMWGVLRVGGVAAMAALTLMPWVVNVMGSNLATSLGESASAAPATARVMADYQIYQQLSTFVPIWAQWLAGIALFWGLITRQRRVVLVGLWSALLVSVFSLSLVRMPAANFMNSFAVMISLYIPVAVAIGWLASVVIGFISSKLPGGRIIYVLTPLIILTFGLWGVQEQLDITDPGFQLVFPADQDAMAWIRQNTPESARFLVEGFRIYGGTSAVGADAGWWIPQLTKRQNTMPSQYALFNEHPIQPGYPKEIVDIVASLETISLADAEGTAFLCKHAITHIYFGQGRGMIGADVAQLYTPEELGLNSSLEQVFSEDGVRIFEVKADTCD